METINKISFLLLILTLFSCSNTESDDEIDNIDTFDDIKFISEIIFKDSLMIEKAKWSFNYDQYNRIIGATKTFPDPSMPLFQVNYLTNDVSNITLLTDPIKSYDITVTDNTINIIDSNNVSNIRKIHLTNKFIDKIEYYNEDQLLWYKNFNRNDDNNLTCICDDGLHLPRSFSNYEPENDKRPDPLSYIIGESLEIDILILVSNLKISKNTPRKAISHDLIENVRNQTLSYDDDGFITTLDWEFITRSGTDHEIISENFGTRIYNYIEN